MILGLFSILLGVFTFGWGFKTFNDPTCASARISIRYRDIDIICYSAGLGDGPIPGNLLAVGIMAMGLLFLAVGADSISDKRKQKILENMSYVSALEILGSIKGRSEVVHKFSGTEGNLLWSTEKFIFLADEQLAGGLSKVGPIAFSEVERPNFRMTFSVNGYLLEFPGTTLAFSSESGKIKNLKKEIDRFKNANSA